MSNTATATELKTLNNLYQLAYDAHRNTSFSPEVRANGLINEYSSQLDNDLLRIADIMKEQSIGDIAAAQIRYKERYIKHLSTWLGSRTRMASSMIVGPARFPVEQMKKRNEIVQKHYEFFAAWREKVFKMIEKSQRAAVDPLAKAQAELKQCELNQAYYVEVNKIIRKCKSPEEKVSAVRAKYPETSYKACIDGFASYMLTNNNANIKRLRDRVTMLSKKAEKAETIGRESFTYNGVEVVYNHSEDRLQLIFPSKPDSKMIDNLKLHGFKWSPKNMAWQRKLTENAKYATKLLLKEPAL